MNSRKPVQPSLFVAVIALVVALAGTATALPGKNTVTRNDIKKNAVGGSEIKKNAVKSPDIDDGSVKGAEIADGQVGAAELADAEPFHRVGDPGEPDFEDGGEGDCVWGPATSAVSGLNPTSFYKDPLDVVQLAGAASAADGSGGDGQCDSSVAGEAEDAIVFTLPASYQPENVHIVGASGSAAIILPEQGGAINGESLPAGSVLSAAVTGGVIIDGGVFRAAGPGTAPIEASAPARVSLKALEDLAR